MGDVGIEPSAVKFPNIRVHVAYNSDWKCTNQDQYGCYHDDLVVDCEVTFENTGTSEGEKCVNVLTYVDDYLVQEKVACENVRPGDREKKTITYTNSNHTPVS